MHVLFGLKHSVEISEDVTDTGRTTGQPPREDRAQLLVWETLSLAISV